MKKTIKMIMEKISSMRNSSFSIYMQDVVRHEEQEIKLKVHEGLVKDETDARAKQQSTSPDDHARDQCGWGLVADAAMPLSRGRKKHRTLSVGIIVGDGKGIERNN